MVKKSTGKPAAKKSAYTFYLHAARDEYLKKHPDEKKVYSDFSKECSDKWKTVSEKERKKFNDLAAADRLRFDKEMKNYTPPKPKKTKDPNAPKRALSGYFLFTADQRPKIMASQPGLRVGDVAKECGRLWKEASEEVKAKYKKRAEADQARYTKEMDDYKKNGSKANATKGKSAKEEEEEEESEEGDEFEDDDE